MTRRKAYERAEMELAEAALTAYLRGIGLPQRERPMSAGERAKYRSLQRAADEAEEAYNASL